MTQETEIKVELEWSRLLGFDQVRRSEDADDLARLKDARMAKIGSKRCTTIANLAD